MRDSGAIFVEAGDMLSHPPLPHFGDAFKWEKIDEANKERTENPDYSYVGQTSIIPS
jgi:nucleoid-associated protein YgaU